MASIIKPPNNGLITETAQQYYAGSQNFRAMVTPLSLQLHLTLIYIMVHGILQLQNML